MTFFAEYSAIGCGKEKESSQQSAFSTQQSAISQTPFTAKDAKDAKELKDNSVSSMVCVLTTRNSGT
jgi:hypothetical protein